MGEYKKIKLFNFVLVLISTFHIYSKGGDHSGRRFMRYSLCAWVIASVLIIFALIMELTESSPDFLKPKFDIKCWFDSE